MSIFPKSVCVCVCGGGGGGVGVGETALAQGELDREQILSPRN